MATTVKKKRVLTDIDFSKDNSHIALVSAAQGGPCSGADYALILKSSNFSKETIEKIQQIQVTMELPDFLRKFFSVYYEDAEVLARLMGYVEPPEDTEVEPEDWYDNYIQSKVDSFTVLKSLNDAESLPTVLATLDEKQYLAMLTDQAFIEKALKQAETKSDTEVKTTESDTSKIMHEVTESEVSVSKVTKSKGKSMTTQKTDTPQVRVEMVEKSMFDLQKEELNKALETIATFQAEKKASIVKSKTAQFAAVLKDEKVLTSVLKAALALESDEDFNELLTAVTTLVKDSEKSKETLEKSALFQEQGASVSEETEVKESAVARILKAKQTK